MKKNLVLIGMMGVGKSTLGKKVAEKLGLRFLDTDKLIENKHLTKIREIFEKKGEKFFRNEEESIALQCLENKNSVIALGGGAFINKKIRKKVLSDSISVWLDLHSKILGLRLNKNFKRPLLKEKNNNKILEKIYIKRKPIYSLANHRIDCDKLSLSHTTNEILNIYEKY